jgi:hypothetical protein
MDAESRKQRDECHVRLKAAHDALTQAQSRLNQLRLEGAIDTAQAMQEWNAASSRYIEILGEYTTLLEKQRRDATDQRQDMLRGVENQFPSGNDFDPT